MVPLRIEFQAPLKPRKLEKNRDTQNPKTSENATGWNVTGTLLFLWLRIVGLPEVRSSTDLSGFRVLTEYF